MIVFPSVASRSIHAHSVQIFLTRHESVPYERGFNIEHRDFLCTNSRAAAVIL